MNPYLAQARKPLLAYLGLEEIETVSTRIRCDCEDLPEVIGAMRPRMDTRGGHPHMHTAKRHQKAMDCIADRYQAARGLIRSGFAGPVVIADASNILKLVEDALNGIAYKDDSQIVAGLPLKAPRVGTFDWLEIEVTYCEVPHA